jgi:hypothetical protein
MGGRYADTILNVHFRDCNRQAGEMGYCSAHLGREYRHGTGDPLLVPERETKRDGRRLAPVVLKRFCSLDG